jgi:hypothetical protein
MMGFHRWCYFHAHWFYKFVSSYAYELNCQCEEVITQIDLLLEKCREQQRINELIKTKSFILEEKKVNE